MRKYEYIWRWISLLKEKLQVKLLSSLSKVFADEEPNENSWEKGSMLSNEVYSFQAASTGQIFESRMYKFD
jgi:hypothetical protein